MNIKPFDQFFEASDEFRLMKDLEDLGAKERTWTKEQIRTFIKNWLALSKEEKIKKFPTLTKMEKKILYIFRVMHKRNSNS